MNTFDAGGLDLAYLDQGQGEPILLLHGFASNMQVNWIGPGWVETLVADGRRVIAFDHRGHGNSAKPHDPEAYGFAVMAEDARILLDHLGIAEADVMGYSMGARIATILALAHPERVRSLIVGGLGVNLIRGMDDSGAEAIARGLEAPSLEDVTDPAARPFRVFADQTRSDRTALAACIRRVRDPISAADVARITRPTLVAVGTKDTVAGTAADLVPAFADAELLDIPNRDHMQAVGDKVYKQGVLAFLRRRP